MPKDEQGRRNDLQDADLLALFGEITRRTSPPLPPDLDPLFRAGISVENLLAQYRRDRDLCSRQFYAITGEEERRNGQLEAKNGKLVAKNDQLKATIGQLKAENGQLSDTISMLTTPSEEGKGSLQFEVDRMVAEIRGKTRTKPPGEREPVRAESPSIEEIPGNPPFSSRKSGTAISQHSMWTAAPVGSILESPHNASVQDSKPSKSPGASVETGPSVLLPEGTIAGGPIMSDTDGESYSGASSAGSRSSTPNTAYSLKHVGL